MTDVFERIPDSGECIAVESSIDVFPSSRSPSELTRHAHTVQLTDPTQEWSDLHICLSSALRRVPLQQMKLLVPRSGEPVTGDVVVAQIERIGKNARVELPSGRPRTLHVGDRIAAVFGNRYATNQFEGYARAEGNACDMLSMGGLCGLVTSTHTSMKEPTRLRLLGAIADAEGRPIRLRAHALPRIKPQRMPPVTVICGTTMDSGKTHTVISVVRGLRQAGKSVAAIKLTGTACCQDTWKMHDAGASPVLDFVDGGHPSTYLCSTQELMDLFELLTSHAQGVDHIVVEIADGLLQRETAALITHPPFRSAVDSWILAASDPLGVAGAIAVLRNAGITPAAVSGLLTCSRLAMNEAESAVQVRCLTADAIALGALNASLVTERRAATCREVAG
jgi:hypothetical protein